MTPRNLHLYQLQPSTPQETEHWKTEAEQLLQQHHAEVRSEMRLIGSTDGLFLACFVQDDSEQQKHHQKLIAHMAQHGYLLSMPDEDTYSQISAYLGQKGRQVMTTSLLVEGEGKQHYREVMTEVGQRQQAGPDNPLHVGVMSSAATKMVLVSLQGYAEQLGTYAADMQRELQASGYVVTPINPTQYEALVHRMTSNQTPGQYN